QNLRIKIEPMKDHPPQVARLSSRNSSAFSKLAGNPARHTQNMERLSTVLLEERCQLIACRKKTVPERPDRRQGKQAGIEPASKTIFARRYVAVNVIGEPVAS